MLLVLVAAIAAVVVLILTKPEPEAKLENIAPVRVALAQVALETLAPVESATGRLQPAQRVELRYEVAGKLTERKVEPGMRVEVGEVLLELDIGDLQDLYQEADAQYRMESASIRRDRRLLKLARNNVELQTAEVARIEQLRNDSLVSRSVLDAARQQLLQLEGEVSRLEYAVNTATSRLQLKQSARDRAQRNVERTRLQAPFAGVVNDVMLEVGDTVTPNQPAVTLVNIDKLELRLSVRGAAIRSLQLGQSIDVEVAGKTISGELLSLQSDPDPATNTHALRIGVSGAGLRSGMLASARLPLPVQQDALTIPVGAMLSEAGNSYVFGYSDGRLQKNRIRIAERIGERYVISEGLAAGQDIVARDVALLVDGQEVAVDQKVVENPTP